MYTLHVTEYCHAGSIGGTERYVLDLIRGLDASGHRNSIGWLQQKRSSDRLEADGVRILTLPTSAMRVDPPPSSFEKAASLLLDTEKPDLLHFHTFGSTEAALARLARKRGIPYAFTYHSPAWTCRRETMLLYGQKPCDGEVRAWRCSACQAQERLGLPPLSGLIATACSAALGWATLPPGSTTLRRRSAFFYDSYRFGRAIREFLRECDLVVSCCDWSTPVLLGNGARIESIVHCPQGVPNDLADALQKFKDQPRPHLAGNNSQQALIDESFVIGFVGRVTSVKGAHLLMEGFSRMTAQDARLRIVGWEPERASETYARMLLKMAAADSRIKLVPKRSFADTLAEYRHLSLLAIPSTWMETGPLTLLEALALDVNVYGSNRIGQLELLRTHGRIVEPNTPGGWMAALSEAYGMWKQGQWSRAPVHAPLRTMASVASEMADCYRKLCQ